jgi:hypothetical protein
MCAMLTALVPEFTRPTYSSINFGLFPAASTRAGREIKVGALMFAFQHKHSTDLLLGFIGAYALFASADNPSGGRQLCLALSFSWNWDSA